MDEIVDFDQLVAFMGRWPQVWSRRQYRLLSSLERVAMYELLAKPLYKPATAELQDVGQDRLDRTSLCKMLGCGIDNYDLLETSLNRRLVNVEQQGRLQAPACWRQALDESSRRILKDSRNHKSCSMSRSFISTALAPFLPFLKSSRFLHGDSWLSFAID